MYLLSSPRNGNPLKASDVQSVSCSRVMKLYLFFALLRVLVTDHSCTFALVQIDLSISNLYIVLLLRCISKVLLLLRLIFHEYEIHYVVFFDILSCDLFIRKLYLVFCHISDVYASLSPIKETFRFQTF